MRDFLRQNEIEKLKSDHRVERESRYADRIKAILMLNSGLSSSDIAKYLLLDEKIVNNYRDRYLEGGLEGLCVDGHLGRSDTLSLEEQDKLEQELRSKIYPSV